MGFHWASLYYSPDSMLCIFKNKISSEKLSMNIGFSNKIEDYILFDENDW